MDENSKYGLPICSKCGWHNLVHSHRCEPAKGDAANRLSAATEVPSTKLGYGSERVTFQLSDEFVIGLDIRHDLNFQWRYTHCLGSLDHDDALDLVESLNAWHKRCEARKQDK